MLAAGALVAQQVAGRATRDALFLTTFDVTWLPAVMIASAVVSAGGVFAFSAAFARRSPARVLPATVAAATLLLLAEWALSLAAPAAAALAVYVHMAVFGGTVVSGFWSVVNERFDPYTAKRVVGPIGLGASLGGVAGGALAYAAAGLIPVPAMLALMAFFNVVSLLALARLRASGPETGGTAAATEGTGPFAALGMLGRAPYLRDLALVVALGAAAEAILDYVLNAQAAARFPRGQPLMSFFALFHTGVGLIALVAQTTLVRAALHGLGLAGTVALRPAAVGMTALAGVLEPRLATALLARGAHGVLHNSLFRSGYELLYTPLPERQKRPTKTIVDVGFDRLGTVLGGALTLALVSLLGPGSLRALFVATSAGAVVALVVSRRLHRGYVGALEESLRSGLVRLEPDDVLDSTTMATLAHTNLTLDRKALLREVAALRAAGAGAPEPAAERAGDPVLEAAAALRSGDADAVRRALRRAEELDPALAAHALPLLARTDVFLDVLRALRRAAPRITGQLTDALLDPTRPVTLRRRIPRVLRGAVTRRAVEGLFEALRDPDFEVRRQSAHSLARLVEKDAALRPAAPDVFAAAVRELQTGAGGWHDDVDAEGMAQTALQRGLSHVFTLLTLALDRQPVLIARWAVAGGDPTLRGTALEYLENVLPDEVRAALWPHLGVRSRRDRKARPREEVEKELLRSGDVPPAPGDGPEGKTPG
jgi:ATP/ADP translocase